MTRSIKLIVVFCLMSLVSISVYAQTTKVVVIPMAGGDDTIILKKGVEKTGQTLCYDNDGTGSQIVGCALTGQDGDTQRGLAWPTPRFSDNGDGTVTDNLTDLIWLEDANCITFYAGDNYPNNARSWAAALNSANNLADGICGLSDSSSAGDWSLPNVKELLSLSDFSFSQPALSNDAGTGQWTSGSGSAFSGVQSQYYWSSSSIVNNPRNAWVVNLYTGGGTDDKKPDSNYVWPVRAGQ